MNYKQESLRNEPGSKQRRPTRKMNTFGLIPSPKSNRDQFGRADQDIEEFSPSSKARKNPWNSATFDNDDFYGGFSPA
ncbi:MAG: hypothetical protein EOO93_00035 [Pedobacter sp.]|nr:MAG: hypothetical protein EOO93_00035 [Pedobacter sp.]